jgi:hypothetical protein
MARLTDLDTALQWHLRFNHYPPVPLTMVQPCKEAIAAVQESEPHRAISLPEGVSYKGQPTAPAWAIVEQHHLGAFLETDEEE